MSLSFVPQGEDPFGFTSVLSKQVKEGSAVPLSAALTDVQKIPYIDSLTFKPTAAKYYDLFNADIDTDNKKYNRSQEDHNIRALDFRLNPEEQKLFEKNGFVVSERLGAKSFAEVYYKLYSDNLPVFVTSDSILHAWHRTYDAVLEDVENNGLIHSIDAILQGMAAGLEDTHKKLKGTVLENCVLDCDFFLAVGLSLLHGTEEVGKFGQGERIKATLAAVKEEKLMDFELFGRNRTVDFSLFKPRGHYENSENLKKYFKAMIWCGTIDLRVAGPKHEVSTRELGSSIVLYFLLKNGDGLFKLWSDFDNFLQKFIGLTDSMTFSQLGSVLASAKINSPSDAKTELALVALQEHILTMDVGKQHVTGHFYYSSPDPKKQVVLPRTFTLMGQKFTVDNWVACNVVYDRVLDENGKKVQRRIPSVLDIAYSVWNNEHVIPELSRRMTDNNGVRFRDGLPFHTHLIAARKAINSIPENLWNSSIYFMWLATLRSLSVPLPEIAASVSSTRNATQQKEGSSGGASSGASSGASGGASGGASSGASSENTSIKGKLSALVGVGSSSNVAPLPQVALTSAWQDRILNTQCGSWTQLRHDTILYVKQGFGFSTCCEYPAGYVEPNPTFWRQFLHMSKTTLEIVENLTFPRVEKIEKHGTYEYKTNNDNVKPNVVEYYEQFVAVAEKLLAISNKQANNEPLTNDMEKFKSGGFGTRLSGDVTAMSEVRFLKNVMEATHGSGATMYLGWYPSLFYECREDSGKWDPLVADVFTDVPDHEAGDPGCVLHEAVGNVHSMLVAVDRGESVICYAGPVLSHYEFTCPINERKSDSDWREMLRKKQTPKQPTWTESFLVPGENPRAPAYKHKNDKK